MYFDDLFAKRKVNMGNKTLGSKDDFLKKMKEEEEKAKKQKLIDNSMAIIRKFMDRNFNFPSDNFKDSKLIHNLNSLINLIKAKNFDKEKNEKLSILSIQKVSDELLSMLYCRSLSSNTLFTLIHTVSEVLSYSNNDSIKNLLIGKEHMKYTKIFFKLIKGSIFELYFNIKRDYLINEKYNVFGYLYYLNFIFPSNIKKLIYKTLSHSSSFLFILTKILYKHKLILGEYNKELIYDFCGNISNVIIQSRNRINKFNHVTYKYLEELLINCVSTFFNENNGKNQNIIKTNNKINLLNLSINIFDLCCNLEESSVLFLDTIPPQNFLNFFDYITSEIEMKIKDHNCLINDDYFNIFIQIFKKLSEINLNGYDNALFLKKISNILQYIFISFQLKFDNIIKKDKYILNEEENNVVKKIIKIIYFSSNVIENLYLSNLETRSNQMIYDYLINKLIVKYCPKIVDIILNFTVNQLIIIYPKLSKYIDESQKNETNFFNNNRIIIKKESKEEIEENEYIFEVISFIVLNQINYKSNFFFVEFKTTKNIYENLPFNYLFLNMFTKYLISLFTLLISKINFEDLKMISDNIIILCLKSLYLLDGDINFTPNREEFWNNMEMVNKIRGENKVSLLEKMKLIPFIFPLTARLEMGVKEIKRLKEESRNSIRNIRNNPNYFGFIDEEMFEDDDINNVHIKIPRDSIFNTTFMYYMQKMLSPYKRWVVTFVDKLGKVEQGVDAGGLYKEFMYKLSEDAFSSKLGYFEESQIGLLIPTRDALHANKNYNYGLTYEFLGFIVAKAIVDDIKIYPNFSPVFLNNVLEIENSFIDLKIYDPELYKNLVMIKTYEGDVENDLGLYFSLTIEENGKAKTFNLIENGNDIPVTNSNRLTYIKKVTDYYLSYQFKEAVENFRIGMSKIMNMDILRLYTGEELRQIIFGFDKDAFDVSDMQSNCNITGFNMEDKKEAQCLNDFFKILDEFSQKEKEKFLFFCTSLKRLPIGGFSRLRPKFSITKSHSEVPTSSTCVNMLKLPILPYKKMKDILLYVINADAGFYYA